MYKVYFYMCRPFILVTQQFANIRLFFIFMSTIKTKTRN